MKYRETVKGKITNKNLNNVFVRMALLLALLTPSFSLDLNINDYNKQKNKIERIGKLKSSQLGKDKKLSWIKKFSLDDIDAYIRDYKFEELNINDSKKLLDDIYREILKDKNIQEIIQEMVNDENVRNAVLKNDTSFIHKKLEEKIKEKYKDKNIFEIYWRLIFFNAGLVLLVIISLLVYNLISIKQEENVWRVWK